MRQLRTGDFYAHYVLKTILTIEATWVVLDIWRRYSKFAESGEKK